MIRKMLQSVFYLFVAVIGVVSIIVGVLLEDR